MLFSMDTFVSNSEGKTEPKKLDELQVKGNLIKLSVIAILLDYHAVLFSRL